jgi:general secretion pathway protein F
MSLFKYTARDKQGRFVTDVKEGPDRNSVVEDLRQNGLFLIDIEEVKVQEKKISNIFYHLKGKDVISFTRHLSNLLDSGVSLSDALSLLVRQARNPRFKDIITKISEGVAEGGYFWEGLSKYPTIFSPLYVSTVKAGEVGGNLEKVIRKLADFNEQREEIKEVLISILIYPSILLLVGIATVIFLMTFVVPKIIFIFNGMTHPLPLITKILIVTSKFLSKNWILLLFLCVVSPLVLKKIYSQKSLRLKLDTFLYKLPFAGEILSKIIFARFCHILGLLLSNGVSLLDSLGIVQDAVQNQLIAKRLNEVRVKVSEGGSLSASMAQLKIFPPTLLDIVTVGEETGRLEESLLKIGRIYETEAKQEIKWLLGLCEPILIFMLAIAVGLLVMAILLPVMQMNLEIL